MAPDKAMFTTDVAVEDQDEIAQDSSCMLAHSQGTFGRVVHFGINTTAPAAGLSRVPPQNDKNYVTSHTVWYHVCLFLAARTRKKQDVTTSRPRTYYTCSYSGKLLRRYSTGKNKSNPLEPHFET